MEPQKGEGAQTPIFLPEARELPQFSKGYRFKKSYDNVASILEDENIIIRWFKNKVI